MCSPTRANVRDLGAAPAQIVASRPQQLWRSKSRFHDFRWTYPARGGQVAQSALQSRYDRLPDIPPLIVKDTPKPRRLKTLEEAREYVGQALRLGRPAPWREVWHRLKTVASDDEAIEAIGDLRELLEEEDLLLPDGGT